LPTIGEPTIGQIRVLTPEDRKCENFQAEVKTVQETLYVGVETHGTVVDIIEIEKNRIRCTEEGESGEEEVGDGDGELEEVLGGEWQSEGEG
jgi:hypothetical protein